MSGLALQVTPEQMHQAKRLMAAASLEAVRLIHVRAANMKIAACPVKEVDEKPMPTATVNLSPDANRYSIVFGHAIRGERGPESSYEVQVDASFELVYSFPQDMNPLPTKEELQAFADTNAVMHCWPYWRELVQTLVAKMNLPPLLVPVLRWIQQPPKPKDTAEPKKVELEPKQAMGVKRRIDAPAKSNVRMKR